MILDFCSQVIQNTQIVRQMKLTLFWLFRFRAGLTNWDSCEWKTYNCVKEKAHVIVGFHMPTPRRIRAGGYQRQNTHTCTCVSAYMYLLNKTSRHPNHFEDRFRLNAKHIHVSLRLGVVSSNQIIIRREYILNKWKVLSTVMFTNS